MAFHALSPCSTPLHSTCRDRHVTRNRVAVDGVVLPLAAAVLTRLHDEGLLQAHARRKADVAARENVATLGGRLEALAALVAAGDLEAVDYARAARRIRGTSRQPPPRCSRLLGRRRHGWPPRTTRHGCSPPPQPPATT
jgi:hypothetical protein